MSWLARLKNADTPETDATKPTELGKKNGKTPDTDATKPTQMVSVVSVAPLPGISEKNTPDVRARLLALAGAEALPRELVHQLPAADLQDCAGLSDAALTAHLYAMADTAEREACRVPATYTARVMCRHCGPVWLSPAVAAVLPVVAGWPQALGCPWCHVTPPEGMAIPRPPVTSATCAHWTPDSINPEAGVGACKCGYHYPNERHTCADYNPKDMS